MTTNSNYIKLGERSNYFRYNGKIHKTEMMQLRNLLLLLSSRYKIQVVLTQFKIAKKLYIVYNIVYKMTVMSREMERKHKKYKRSAMLS